MNVSVETLKQGELREALTNAIRRKNSEEYRKAFEKGGEKKDWANYRRQMKKFIKNLNYYIDAWNAANTSCQRFGRPEYRMDRYTDEDIDYMLDYGLWR